MQGWKEKLLSQAGKEVIIKAVVQSIPTYLISVFKLLVGLRKDIEAMIQKFWWGQGETKKKKKIHWVKWSALCLSKSVGEMGFRDIQNFNNALLENRFGGYYIIKILYFIRSLAQNISLIVASWKCQFIHIVLLLGRVFYRQGMSLISVQCGEWGTKIDSLEDPKDIDNLEDSKKDVGGLEDRKSHSKYILERRKRIKDSLDVLSKSRGKEMRKG